MQKKVKTIFLEGKLGKLFGRKWELFVSSPAEAMRAINVNTGGRFRAYLETEGSKKHYKVAVGNKKNIIDTQNTLSFPLNDNFIYILPVIKGKSDELKIVAGVVLIAVAYYAGFGEFVTQTLYSTGASLVLGGIAGLLTSVPNFDQESGEEDSNRQSNIFQGNVAAIAQGVGVGMAYGRILVAPMPISVSIETEDKILPPVTIGDATQPDNI
jgi:predicted phage tail protein